jgi:hypothetical protein
MGDQELLVRRRPELRELPGHQQRARVLQPLAALAALGAPARTYHVGPYTVYVYNKNLLAKLPHQ